VYRLSDDLALVQTADFFSPVVDDPYDCGRIAAANCLSDCYAMGGRALCALNLVAWPRMQVPEEALQSLLRGGHDAFQQAGVTLAGGHSMYCADVFYGAAVTGLIHPDRIVTNAGAKPGDALVLTKPLGSGVISYAIHGQFAPDEVVVRATEVMAQLNKDASEVMVELGAHAATDITGYGLAGHALEMARAMGIRIVFASIGFESFSDILLRNLNKGLTVATNLEAIDLIRQMKNAYPRELGYRRSEGGNHGFIHPTPWDTPETEAALGRVIETHGLATDILPNHSTPLIIQHASGLGDWIRAIETRERVRFTRIGAIVAWWDDPFLA